MHVCEDVYESSIIFQSFVYANIPVESPSYAPTFFKFITHTLLKLCLFLHWQNEMT